MSDFKLYEINDLLLQAIEARNAEAESNEGIYDENWDKFLDDIKLERSQKLLDCARYVKTVEGMAGVVGTEIMALRARQAAYLAKAECIKKYISRNMVGEKEIIDANTRLSWRKSEGVIIDDPKAIPEQYIKTEIKFMVADIKQAFKNAPVPGAHIETRQNLQIK